MPRYLRKFNIRQQLFILFLIYTNVLLLFSLLYLFLEWAGWGMLADHVVAEDMVSRLDIFLKSVYFSAVTLLAVGYGDVTPLGLARAVAVVEAMVGYLLPAAIVVQLITPLRKQRQQRGLQ